MTSCCVLQLPPAGVTLNSQSEVHTHRLFRRNTDQSVYVAPGVGQSTHGLLCEDWKWKQLFGYWQVQSSCPPSDGHHKRFINWLLPFLFACPCTQCRSQVPCKGGTMQGPTLVALLTHYEGGHEALRHSGLQRRLSRCRADTQPASTCRVIQKFDLC